jgi:hypothetical protein
VKCSRRRALPAVIALAALVASLSGVSAAPRRESAPPLAEILARYASALDDAGTSRPVRFETYGVLRGAGLTGSFHTWRDAERELDEQMLGPRRERVLRNGERVTVQDSDGNVRELRGPLLRRARTEELIDSAGFVHAPERCALRGEERIGAHRTWAVDVSAAGGEIETLYLDAETGLPDRVAYDDYDGRETLDFSDWRSIGGHRFPFRTVASDGEHAFDTIAETTDLVLDPPFDAALFAPLQRRMLEAETVQTVALTERDGHLYAPVRIGNTTYAFLVDSGAQSIVLDSGIARALALTEEGTLEASGTARTGGLHVARLPELALGDAVLRDLVVSTLDLTRSTGGVLHIDGILGYPFFASSIVRLDFANGTMTFGPPGSLERKGTRIALELDRSLPEARFRLNDRIEGMFVVDTGNAADLLLYRPFVDAHPGLVPVTTNGGRSWGIGGATASYATTLETLALDDISLHNTRTEVMLATRGAFADRVDAGNVGLGVLRKFIVTFDFPGSALYLERGPAFDDGRNRAAAR